MINLKCFFKGVSCAKKIDSPAIALGVSFIAIGALLRNLGFTIQESVFSTFLTYALPGSLVMALKILSLDTNVYLPTIQPKKYLTEMLQLT